MCAKSHYSKYMADDNRKAKHSSTLKGDISRPHDSSIEISPEYLLSPLDFLWFDLKNKAITCNKYFSCFKRHKKEIVLSKMRNAKKG